MPVRNTHSTDPAYNIGRQSYPAIPYDENSVRPSVLALAIVDDDGEITGYLPARVSDNGNGTCDLFVTSQS